MDSFVAFGLVVSDRSNVTFFFNLADSEEQSLSKTMKKDVSNLPRGKPVYLYLLLYQLI